MNKQTLVLAAGFLLAATTFTTDLNAQTRYPVNTTYSLSSGTSGWDDRSDELPGMVSGKSIALLSGAVLTAVVASHVIRKNRKKKDAERESARRQQIETSALWNTGDDREYVARNEAPPVNLIVGLPGARGADSRLTLGFSVSF